ncbi:hypothetical protein BJY04DRAFT_220356 [Aspergillus karnatakaensis]|uniref:uncharacterized protein n=1 Tax=Aspergillus karnatakaensis TaxID=1810916 RepID=UPI003CCCD4D4
MPYPPNKPLDIIIVGGSITAIMHGITLHRLGHSIRILEQSLSTSPTSHLAGIVPSPVAIAFLNLYDNAAHIPLGTVVPPIKSSGGLHPVPRGNRIMTSWGALYFRLRANFDSVGGGYIPDPPAVVCLDGEGVETAKARAVYESGQRVVDVREDSGEKGKVAVVVEDVALGTTRTLSADLVLGADGASSIVRKIFLGETVSRRYAGYVAWRGVVPESAVSEEAREAFKEDRTHAASSRKYGQVTVYTVPGPTGSLEPGTRNINFIWYNPIPISSLSRIMTDTHGHAHRTTIPQGLMDPDIWDAQVALGASLLPRHHFEIMSKITSPFLHLITDYTSPRASFLDGRVLLVGDAHTLLRPHIGYTTSMSALEAGWTEELVTGKITLKEWEDRVNMTAYLHYCRGIWFGEAFIRPGSIRDYRLSAVWYWVVLAWYWVRVCWEREISTHRGLR